jgi:hypothetical protein
VTLHCTTPTRIDLLFTMSNNPQALVRRTRLQSDVSRTMLPSQSSGRGTTRLRPDGLRRGSLRSPAGLPSRSAVRREGWWSQTGSNRRPHACKARALPAELWPHDRKDECQAARSSRRWLAEVRVDQSAYALSGFGATAFAHLLACRAEAPLGAKAGGPGKT